MNMNPHYENQHYNNDWEQANHNYIQDNSMDNNFGESADYKHYEMSMQHNPVFQMNPMQMQVNPHIGYVGNQVHYTMGNNLYHNQSSSSNGNMESYSHSEEGEIVD